MIWLAGLTVLAVIGVVARLDLAPVEAEKTNSADLDAFLDEHGPGHTRLDWTAPNPRIDLIDLPDAVPQAGVDHPAMAPAFADFDAETEDLMVVWDDSTSAPPAARLRPSAEDPGMLELYAGETVYARVPASTGLTEAHVAVIPLRAAQEAGLVASGSGQPCGPSL